jgi:hypothetical protein
MINNIGDSTGKSFPDFTKYLTINVTLGTDVIPDGLANPPTPGGKIKLNPQVVVKPGPHHHHHHRPN